MSNKEISPIVKSILTALNNAHELIVLSNKRTDARNVMRALRVYAKNRNFPLPQEKFDNFFALLLDCRQDTLSYILTDIAQTVVRES